MKICPHEDQYKLYYAQCLYEAGRHEEAGKACTAVDNPKYAAQVAKLQASLLYSEEDINGARALVEQLPTSDPDLPVNQGWKSLASCRLSLHRGQITPMMGLLPQISFWADDGQGTDCRVHTLTLLGLV